MKNIPGIFSKNSFNSTAKYLRPLVSLVLVALFLMPSAQAQFNRVVRDQTDKAEAVLVAINVTTTADGIDAAASCPAVTLASLPGPGGQTTLREAICAANSNAGPDSISFSVNGIFVLTGAANEDNGTSGDFDIKQSLTINGNGASNTILDGGGIERIFDVFPSAATTFDLFGLTLQNGDTRTASFKEGGAVYLHNNVTSSINSCQIINNFSAANGAIENRGTMTINGSTISNNQNIPASGSVVGGGIHNVGAMTINNTTISNNSVRGEGGGIATSTAAAVTVNITNSTISGNTASITGGGLGNGGGLSTTGNQGAIIITNSTISGNRSDNNGGGAYFVTPGGGTGNATLTHVTITNNTADQDNNGAGAGGGLTQVTAAVTLRNTLVAGNFNSTPATRDDISGALVAASSFNLIGDGTGMSGITNGTNANQVGSGASPINPVLGALASNGGATQTHVLLPGSPAIDKGNAFGITTDQRGISRPFDNPSITPAPGGDNSDIGAYERNTPTAAGVSLAGGVFTADGRGISNVAVYLTRADGTFVMAKTGSFGYYAFENVASGETYTLTVVSRRYAFSNPVQVIAVTDSLADLNFFAEPF